MRVVLLMAVMLAMASLALTSTCGHRPQSCMRRRRGIVKRAADEGDEFQKKVEVLQEAAAEMEREVNDVEEEAALDLVMEEMEELVEKKVELQKKEDEKLEGVKIDLDEFEMYGK